MENTEKTLLGTREHMSRAFSLAHRASGYTAPNPMVGAVLVHNDRIIGQGWHHYYGSDHAEINCLKNVAPADKHLIPESTMYVNLEPCAHQGITPPCAHRLVQERIREVIIANTDPFEKVSGKGIDILRAGGIAVDIDHCVEEGLWLNRRFFCYHRQHRPYIILKWAQTTDGFIAPPDRTPLQISSPESHVLSHRWRAQEAAIMIGATTALVDNPQLTTRHAEGHHPLRIALDRNLTLPHTHHLFNNATATWLINQRQEILSGNVHSVKIPFNDELLPNILHRLHQARILSVIIEGGAALLTSFIQAGLWDEARVFTAPTILDDGIPAPTLPQPTPASTSAVGTDTLQLFVNQNSKYLYIDGMEL